MKLQKTYSSRKKILPSHKLFTPFLFKEWAMNSVMALIRKKINNHLKSLPDNLNRNNPAMSGSSMETAEIKSMSFNIYFHLMRSKGCLKSTVWGKAQQIPSIRRYTNHSHPYLLPQV